MLVKTTSGSCIIGTRNVHAKQTFLLKLSGWLCVPCFCSGCVCLAISSATEDIRSKYDAVIKFYGGEKIVVNIAEKVKVQTLIFRHAVTEVNKVVNPRNIVADIDMFMMCKDMCPLFKAVSVTTLHSFISVANKSESYVVNVWNKYLELGGNYHIVIYGIIEYLCTVADPTSIYVTKYVDLLIKDTAFRSEVLSHKLDAGF